MVEPKKQPTLEEALNAVATMESLAGSAFAKVQGLCSLALHALEAPSGQRDTEAIAQTLRVILHTVGEVSDYIGWEAETVGIDAAQDAGQLRRCAARVAVDDAARARGEGVAHG